MSRVVRAIKVTIGDASNSQRLTNQLAEYLPIFVSAGSRGITKSQFSGGLHLGDIVMKLRRKGFEIETIMEPNSGNYGGSHARYILRDKVHIEHDLPKKTKPATGRAVQVSNSNTTESNLGGVQNV